MVDTRILNVILCIASWFFIGLDSETAVTERWIAAEQLGARLSKFGIEVAMKEPIIRNMVSSSECFVLFVAAIVVHVERGGRSGSFPSENNIIRKGMLFHCRSGIEYQNGLPVVNMWIHEDILEETGRLTE